MRLQGVQTPRYLPVGLLLSALTIAGCTPPGIPTYPVAGRVTMADGTPLDGGDDGSIIFESMEHGVSATGSIDSAGRFTLTTFEVGDGAVAGMHRVAISPPTPAGDPDRRAPGPRFPPKFRDLDASGLEVEVTPTNDNQIAIQLIGS